MLKAPITGALLLVTLLAQACSSDNVVETNRQNGMENRPAIATLVPIARRTSASTDQAGPSIIQDQPAERAIPSTATQSARTRPSREPIVTTALEKPTKRAPTPSPEVAVPTKQPPNPVEPENPDQTSFVDQLDAGDRYCLPQQMSNDHRVVDLMAQMDTQANREFRNCLSEEAQFELYLLTMEDRTFAPETHRCLWAGRKPLTEQHILDLSPESPEYDRTANVKFLAPVVIELYCKGSDPAWLGLEIDGSNERFKPQIETIYCMVDAKGGPRDFVEWMLEDDQAVDVPRQLYLPVGVNQFCRFTSLAWPRCWAALVR